MSLFICAKCGYIDNTATSSYWMLGIGSSLTDLEYAPELKSYKGAPLCSECAKVIGNRVVLGKWHGLFPKVAATPAQKRMAGHNGILP